MEQIKCKLGHAELHKPAPGFGDGEAVSVSTVELDRAHSFDHILNLQARAGVCLSPVQVWRISSVWDDLAKTRVFSLTSTQSSCFSGPGFC